MSKHDSSTLRAVLAVACVVAGGARPAAAADCVPAATVSGDVGAAAEVTAALARLGVEGARAEPRACAVVAVTVRRDGAGLTLAVRVGDRIETRVVADSSIAAAWIESWVRDEAAPLWTAPPPVALGAPSLVARVEPPVPERRARRARRSPELAVLLGHDASAGRTAWDGIAASAGYRIGAWSAGLAGRYVTTTSSQSGDPDDGSGGTTAARRATVAVLVTIDRRFALGRVAVAPTIAAGVARTTSRRHEPDPPCFSGECVQAITYVGDGFTASNVAARLGAGLGVAVPLAGWLFLDGRLGVEVAAGAHTGVHRHDPARYPVAEAVGISPGDPLLDLPGDPAWLITAAIGLRIEVP